MRLVTRSNTRERLPLLADYFCLLLLNADFNWQKIEEEYYTTTNKYLIPTDFNQWPYFVYKKMALFMGQSQWIGVAEFPMSVRVFHGCNSLYKVNT